MLDTGADRVGRPPRTPAPHASLPSFVKIARRLSNVPNFPSGAGQASVSIHSRAARVRNLICASVGKRVGCRFAKTRAGL